MCLCGIIVLCKLIYCFSLCIFADCHTISGKGEKVTTLAKDGVKKLKDNAMEGANGHGEYSLRSGDGKVQDTTGKDSYSEQTTDHSNSEISCELLLHTVRSSLSLESILNMMEKMKNEKMKNELEEDVRT